jgi:hypothetical protein
MKRILKMLLTVLLTWVPFMGKAQIDSLIVEKYYISDANDATDNTGGGLPEGSITYRIFVDLAPDSKLQKIFGDENHPIRITGTEVFFNNHDRGKTFGKEIRATRLDENTVALDTWITIGHASDIHFGILKINDPDGSIVGGLNNDGGSMSIPGGLLVNTNPGAGIPLTASDGLISAVVLPSNYQSQLNGVELSSTTDTTIFGNLSQGKEFLSTDFSISSSPVEGTSEYNRVLIAQLTTRGEISFKLNIVVEERNGSQTNLVTYVAENPSGEEKTNRFLTYPTPPPPIPVCGCKDPDYLEYDRDVECHIADSCKTIISLGCTDPHACNYNPAANFNTPELCCYPGSCMNRDIRVVCPQIQGSLGLEIYPNPAANVINTVIKNGKGKTAEILMFDSSGTCVMSEFEGITEERMIHQIAVSHLSRGYYHVRVVAGTEMITGTFIKN